MCTVTILPGGHSTLITMNRDEQINREEEKPAWRDYEGVKIAAPLDIDSSGTWVGLNREGVVACLLNRYDDVDSYFARSRGDIVFDILKQGDLPSIYKWIENEFNYSGYNPFKVLIVKDSHLLVYDFDGNSFSNQNQPLDTPIMFTSSSWKAEDVVRWRHEQFKVWMDAGMPSKLGIPSFNILRPKGLEQWTPFVQRDTVHTKSITQIAFYANNNKPSTIKYWTHKSIVQGKLTPLKELVLEPSNLVTENNAQ